MAKRDNTDLTFEGALAKVESIVESMEQGKVGLQELIQQYEEGMKLIQRCRGILTEADQKIQALQLSAGGLTAAPFEPGHEGTDETEASGS